MTAVQDRSIIDFSGHGRLFIRSLSVLPFESALALASVWSGLSSLFGWSAVQAQALNAALPEWLVLALNLLYIGAGIGMLLGVGWGHRPLEAAGLILLITSLVVRATVLFAVIGFDSSLTGTFVSTVLFSTAAVSRIRSLIKHDTIARTNGFSVVR